MATTADTLPLARFRALVEAVRLISARGDDLDATLDALAEQVKRLLGADVASIHLAVGPREVRRRQVHPFAIPGHELGQAGNVHRLDDWSAGAVASGRCRFAADYQAEPEVMAEAKQALPGVVSALVVPLLADEEFVGVLFADWARRVDLSPADLEAAQALGAHAAVAIRTARLAADARDRLRRLEAAQRVSTAVNRAGDLDAVLSTLLDEVGALAGVTRGIVALVDPDRRYVRGRVARGCPPGLLEATVRKIHAEPRPDEDMFALVVRTGEQRAFGPADPARHRPTFEQFGVGTGYSVLTPITDGGEVIGVFSANVPVTREPDPEFLAVLRLIAEQAAGAVARERLRLAEREAALLEGAAKTARALAHQMNQPLALLTGYSDLIGSLPPAEAATAAAEMADALRELGDLTARLLRIVRFEETQSPVGPMLDLGAATLAPGEG